MIAAVLQIVLCLPGFLPQEKDNPIMGVEIGEVAFGAYNPRLKGKALEFDVRVRNISKNVIKLGKQRRFSKDINLGDGTDYVFSWLLVKNKDATSEVAELTSTWLVDESSLLLYPKEKYEFTVTIAGLNLPIEDVEFTFTVSKTLFDGHASFRFVLENGKMVMGKTEKQKAEMEKEAQAARNKKIKKDHNAQVQKQIEAKTVDLKPIQERAAKLDKAYRELAKKATAADKADQFEDAKRFKEESLKGYAEWKKEKAKLDMLNAELKRLKSDIEP